ncbi:nuclear transport factor 2 family protein [Sphingopyxis granuli]|uniref:SnoaL-like domain-containing protein n=1 Tax=Sphingopyxis granuli TaxID=267128 RepID=A0AA86GID8_9SPHN|nr:nuclear transport factor 2 family protein [Sphingopyxis granuli]AMG72851.1 Uncharacterized protein SGRAN_0455 [Sphingopyxis granuli]
MNELDKMLIERECHRLMVDYNIYNDTLDIEAFLTLWTEDCVFSRVVPEPVFEVSGHDGLRAAMDQIIVHSDRLRRHLLVNPRIIVHGPDRAEGFCIGLAIYGPAGDRSLPVAMGGVELVGEYRDQYRRTPEGWKIARRELTRVIDLDAR